LIIKKPGFLEKPGFWVFWKNRVSGFFEKTGFLGFRSFPGGDRSPTPVRRTGILPVGPQSGLSLAPSESKKNPPNPC